MFEKVALTQVEIADIIARRWSGRAFNTHLPVEQDKLMALLEAARWAPSCFGDQPWRFIVWDRSNDLEGWQRALGCLAEGNQTWAQDAPLLLAAIADSEFAHNAKPNRWAQYDTGAAAMSLCLQATELGLMVHQMGGYDALKLRAEFHIPERYVSIAMLAVGYQLAEQRIPEEMREREYAARQRGELGERFFRGTWGQSIQA